MSRENVKEKVSPIEGDRNREFVRTPRKISNRSSVCILYIYTCVCVYAHVEVKFLISNDSDRSRVRFSSGETRPIGGREIGKNWGESCGIGKESVARIDELFEGRFYNALPTHFSSAKLVPAYPVEGEMGRTVGRREH